MKKNKIIFQVNTDDRIGGAAKVAVEIMKGVEKSGGKVLFYVKNKTSFSKNVKVIDHENHSQRLQIHKKLSRYSKKIIGKDAPSFLRYSLRDFKCKIFSSDIDFFSYDFIKNNDLFFDSDIVHLHNLHGNYFNIEALSFIADKKPTIWTAHDMWPITGHCAHSYDCDKFQSGCFECPYLDSYFPLLWDNTKYLWKKKLKVYKNSKLNIVVPSLWLKEKFEKSILKDQKIHLIHNGIDCEHVFFPRDKKKCREKIGLPLDKKIIVFVASYGKKNKWKGWEYFRKIAVSCRGDKNLFFLCVGGKENEKDENNIKFIKYIKNDINLSELYNACDILLNPSFAESFGLVMLEALACGLPIVTFPVGVAEEIVEHKKSGYIATYRNFDDLKKGLIYFLNQPDEIINSNLRITINHIKKEFSTKVMVKKYLDLYNSVLRDE